MKIQTFSIVIGTEACDADCPFCISHTTGFHNLPAQNELNVKRLKKAQRLAKMAGATTVLFTGKGEPTLYPKQISKYLSLLQLHFPFFELQTNALQIGYLADDKQLPKYQQLTVEDLKQWYTKDLNTIAISVVDVDREQNSRIYRANYPDLAKTIAFLHDLGFSVRLCVMMQRGIVDTPEKVFKIAEWCKNHEVEQLTIRPIRAPKKRIQNPIVRSSSKQEIYIEQNGLTGGQEEKIKAAIINAGTHLLTLMQGNHQALVFDLHGQNICIADCLTVQPDSDEIRTLIFYGDGKLMYDWQYDGARLL